MHALFFEVRPHPGHLEHYFEHVARLRPVLARHSGLAFLDCYSSLRESDLLLSDQLWESEEAIVGWRTDAVHRRSQSAGRQVHFANYHIRVGARVLYWKPNMANASAQAEADSDALHVVAIYGRRPVETEGFRNFESVNHKGNFIALRTVDGLALAEATLKTQIGTPEFDEGAAYCIRRDYGQFDRTQAPS